MYFVLRKGDSHFVYQGVKPPKVKVETLDVPAKERGPDRRWRKVTARLVRLTVKGGTLLGRIPNYNLRYYCGLDNVPTKVGEVITIPKDREAYVRQSFPKKRRT